MQFSYDFSDEGAYDSLARELDHLNNKELAAVQKALEEVKEETMAHRSESAKYFFEHGIVTILKDWAEKSNATMEIHEERELVYTVVLTSIYGFTMDSKEIWVKQLLATADNISYEKFGDGVLLDIEFDFTNGDILK